MAISATESFLTQLDYAAQGKSLAEVWDKGNLIEFENLLSSKAEESDLAEEVIEEESSGEIVEEVLVEEVIEESSVELTMAEFELTSLFENISGMDLTEPEPEIVLESVEPVVEIKKPQIDPVIIEEFATELKDLFSEAAGYDLFSTNPKPKVEPEPEIVLETKTEIVGKVDSKLKSDFFTNTNDLPISEKYGSLPVSDQRYDLDIISSKLINNASGFMNQNNPKDVNYKYENYDPSVAQGDANWQMDLFSQKNSKTAKMVSDVSALLEKHKAELPQEEYKILEGNAIEQAAQYLHNAKINEEETPTAEESFDSKVVKLVNRVLASNVGWGQRGMSYGSGEVKLGKLDDVDIVDRSATHQFIAWDNAAQKYIHAEGTTPVGDIQGVTAGTGLSGGGTQGTVTLDLDVSELSAIGTTASPSDFVIIQDVTDNSTKKVLVSNLVTSTGDIEGVTAGTGLTGGGTSGTVTVSIDSTVTTLTGTQTLTNKTLTSPTINDATIANFNGTGTFTLTSTDAGSAAAPELVIFRDSASPDNGDYLGQIKFLGESDTGVTRNYAKITAKIKDASNGTEDGIIEIAHLKNGSQNINVRSTSTEFKIMNGTDFDIESHDAASTGLRLNNTLVTATAAELNIMDGGTSATSTTLTDADRVIINDQGTMKQVALTDLETYFEDVDGGTF